jgi:hypothetical protein
MVRRQKTVLAILCALAAVGAGVLALSDRDTADRPEAGLRPSPAGTGTPEKHPRIVNLSALGEAEAERYYEAIRNSLKEGFADADDPVTSAYATWRRYNRYPYASSRHGDLLVNNYANAHASRYGDFENAGAMPEGAVIVKDSFTVTRDGYALPGPLFVMEKMAAGYDQATGDWRFMLFDRGKRAGMTGGPDAHRVRFCADCHGKAGPGSDYLFFVPKRARRDGSPR